MYSSDSMPCREALQWVLQNCTLCDQAEQTIRHILDQQGCEEIDSACSDGYLTTLMDIWIYG